MNWTKEKIEETYEAVLRAAMTDEEFRAEFLADPTAAIKKLTGMALPEGFKLKIVEEEPVSEDPDYDMTLYLPPMLDDELSDNEMEQVAGGGMSDIIKKTKHIDEYVESWAASGYKVLKDK